jgi:hypothetical protein
VPALRACVKFDERCTSHANHPDEKGEAMASSRTAGMGDDCVEAGCEVQRAGGSSSITFNPALEATTLIRSSEANALSLSPLSQKHRVMKRSDKSTNAIT